MHNAPPFPGYVTLQWLNVVSDISNLALLVIYPYIVPPSLTSDIYIFENELFFISTSLAPSFTLIKLLFYKLISYASKFSNVSFPPFNSTSPVVIVDSDVSIFISQFEIPIDDVPDLP
jgi:hypothetical protein